MNQTRDHSWISLTLIIRRGITILPIHDIEGYLKNKNKKPKKKPKNKKKPKKTKNKKNQIKKDQKQILFYCKRENTIYPPPPLLLPLSPQ